MNRFQNSDEILSVLYVDFDNIYSRLLEQEESLARTFATYPQRWLRWIEGHALRMMYGDGIRRRILKRYCYMCPEYYQEFRPYFLRSAFHVEECPHRNSRGTTNADIQLVMDCMDTLNHATRFDEFIILSGGADFTPLLLRIQECARRSLVLSAGYTSPAYAAACSWRIREDWFIAQALEEPRLDDVSLREEKTASAAPAKEMRTPSASAKYDYDGSRPEALNAGLNLPGEERRRIVEIVKRLVLESGVPVPLPSIAQVIQGEMGSNSDWYGAGTLRALLGQLALEPLELSRINQGYVFNPSRHERPVDNSTLGDLKQSDPELYDFAMKVNRLTDIPVLHPDFYARLFSLIAREFTGNRLSRAEALRAIEDRCEENGLPIDQSQIAFVVDAVWHANAKIKSNDATSTEKLSEAYYQRVCELCGLTQMAFGKPERQMLDRWLRSSEVYA